MSQWIECKKQEPKKDGRYIVCEQYNRSGFNWIGVMSLRNGIWDSQCVTHWQELPKEPDKVDK